MDEDSMRWAKSNLVPSLWIGNSIISTRCISCLMLSSFGWSALFWMPRCGSIQSCQLQTFVGFTMSEIEALYPPWTLSCFFFNMFYQNLLGSGPSGSKGWSTSSKCSLNIKVGNEDAPSWNVVHGCGLKFRSRYLRRDISKTRNMKSLKFIKPI